MTKNDIYVVVDTPKKAKNLKKLLEMFGEKINEVAKIVIDTGEYTSESILCNQFNKVSFMGRSWYTFSHTPLNKFKVSIKQLRTILAKEHLKSGDYVVSDNNFICRIDKIEDDGIHFSNPFFGVYDISYFKRYATPEEIALLESEQKELEVGKWYKHPNNKYPNWLVYYGGNKKCYGFRTSGEWNYDSKNEWFEYLNAYPMVEATPQEVESALIEEAKKRYKNLDFKNVKYLHEINELWTSSEYFDIQLFANGKWAEVIKPKEKINDSDIATIEALHDVLLDNHKYDFNSKLLANARELCKKLHNIVGG